MTTRVETDDVSILNGNERFAQVQKKLPDGDIRPEQVAQGPVSKYKHYLAVHSSNTVSKLTPGSPDAPSFVGFRNLMVLVICACLFDYYLPLGQALTRSVVVSNLRLMIVNFKKASTPLECV